MEEVNELEEWLKLTSIRNKLKVLIHVIDSYFSPNSTKERLENSANF
jgi:hypothetical protein